MKFRRLLAVALAGSMVFSMSAVTANAEETTAITLWTYPVGNWTDAATVDGLIANFTAAHPEISVTVEYLDYTNGDDQVNTAIEGGQAPDVILEGPERLVANWGARGVMVDLSDLWTDEAKVRARGFKRLGLMPKALPYVVKPLVVGLIPQSLLEGLKDKKYRRRFSGTDKDIST